MGSNAKPHDDDCALLVLDLNPPTRRPRSPADDSSNSSLVPHRVSNGGFESDQDNKSRSQLTPYKKARISESDYRKDREEWTDTAIAVLLEVYTEKFNQLNRGNLRGRDWEEVADAVRERCGSGGSGEEKHRLYKTVEQCKNKIDNMKKRYKVEVHKMNTTGAGSCHWHWFKKIEVIMGNSTSNSGSYRAVDSEEKSGASSLPRQSKRFMSNNLVANTVKSKALPDLKWRRLVLKISGTALGGSCQSIDSKVAMQIANEVATACRLGVEVALVVGGRNFFCGDFWVSETRINRPTAYQLGMMATVMNSILLQSALEKSGVQVCLQSAFSLPGVAEPYNRQRATRHLAKGRVVIFGGISASSGNPLFTTDSAAALRASEINADAVLKATNVEGVFDCHADDSSVTLDHISFREAPTHAIPMDMMAIQFCEENRIPVVIFNLLESGNVLKALRGEQVGTLIDQTGGMARLT